MSIYVEHPWDKVGPPPPLGQPYHVAPAAEEEVAPYVADAIIAALRLQECDNKRAEAETLEEEAHRLEDEAKPILETLPQALREAIEDDPFAIDNADDVRRVMGRPA